jgi:thymidylate kinase
MNINDQINLCLNEKTKLNIRKWEFIKDPEAFCTIYLDVPINEKKKHVMRNLNRFEKLEKIEIHGIY